MRSLFNRLAAATVVLMFISAGSVAPCLAAETPPPARKSLARVSPAQMEALIKSSAPVSRQDASTPGTFFRTRKGAVALALVAAGVAFTVWSQHDSRKPVKSPVR